MTILKALFSAAILSSISVSSALAQPDQAAPVGDAPASVKAPDTPVIGTINPANREPRSNAVEPTERATARRVTGDATATRICLGCRAEPGPNDPLSLRIRPTDPPENRAAQPDSPPPAAPRQQSDLDTVALASAHRERADSVQEKTTGLWQSWLVSVCDGCGDQKPARALKLEDWPDRASPVSTGSVGHTTAPEKKLHAEAKRVAFHPRGTLEANLSPENVGSIRRMPPR